jgi:hypothetical protein
VSPSSPFVQDGTSSHSRLTESGVPGEGGVINLIVITVIYGLINVINNFIIAGAALRQGILWKPVRPTAAL